MLLNRSPRPQALSVVVIFHNMPREAPRTLHSLSRAYQGLVHNDLYEVIVIDNGSSKPLSSDVVKSFGSDFSYHYVETDDPSPVEAINKFVVNAHFDNVMVIIDGARILSPGIARLTLIALNTFAHPFIYTLGMHLGHRPQNYLVGEGYNQSIEDELLESTGWTSNGHALFSISSVALSSKGGFFSKLTESNCFTVRKEDFVKIGLYQSQFKSPGGGLCNLELFNRLNDTEWIQPIMLLGEATFHQFHEGVATNVPMEQHPWKSMEMEYERIMGKRYSPNFRPPLYIGSFRNECADLYNGISRDEEPVN
jgi:glycosyltransferase involved in cell wall biosynthesis